MLLRGRSYYHPALFQRLFLSVVFASLTIGGLTALLSFSTKNFSLTEVNAAPPQIINYQAKVTDSSGVTVTDGSYAIKFKLYDASTSGNCLYVASGTCASPTSVTTTITSGVFSVLLGDTSAGFNTLTTSSLVSSSVYLGVTIGTDSEMSPRKRLVASPYAINSLTLNNMDAQTNGGTSSYILAANSTGNLTITGTGTSTFSQGATFATSGGQVGIGTSTPNYKLDVNGDISAATGIRDGLGWNQNQANVARNSLGTNNGGFGGGATPGNILTTSTDVSFFITSGLDANLRGFIGAVFDGRYVYFIPYYNEYWGLHGRFGRYDTTGSFTATSSWSYIDLDPISGYAGAIGYGQGAFDGRYIYLIPVSSGKIVTRYDTTQQFSASSSYTFFNSTTVSASAKGFGGATFDGRYLYLIPYYNSDYDGLVVRYDTTLSFTSASSWTSFDTTTVNANSKGFLSGVFDGRYIYMIPFSTGVPSGQVTRYDTTGNFTTAASWSVFDTASINGNSKGFAGGVFDGRYIYMVPDSVDGINGSGQVTRYDTTASFTATSSYTFFDMATTDSNAKNYYSGIFDGRFVYFVPFTGNTVGRLMKYDTTGSFTASSSWSGYNLTNVNASLNGFAGGVFDGQYIYLASEFDNFSGTYMGRPARIRAWSGGVDSHPSVNQTATTKDLYLDSQGQIGLGTVLPSSRLTVVNGGIDVGNGSTTSSVSSTFLMIGKTSTKASGTLYIDQSGTIFSSSTFIFSNAGTSTIIGTGLVLKDINAGVASSSRGFGLLIPGGFICVSASSSKCIPSGGGSYASGSIYAEAYRSTSAADVAENFPSDDALEPGDVVTFDPTQSEHIKKTTEANETLIAGVVSTKPGFILGSDGPNTYPLALTGRVPVKVTNENGAINIGDLLISASKPGYAMKYDSKKDTGSIIGVAIEALPSDQSEGKIIVFLRGTFTEPNMNTNLNTTTLNIQTNTTESIITYNQDIDLTNHILHNVQAILGTNHWSITADGSLTVEKIQTKDLQTESLTITATDNESQTAGRGTILAGTTSLVINNANVTDESEIFVTFSADPESSYFITNKIIGQSFIVNLTHAPSHDVPFTYWMVNIHEQREIMTPPPAPPSSAAPEPTPGMAPSSEPEAGPEVSSTPDLEVTPPVTETSAPTPTTTPD